MSAARGSTAGPPLIFQKHHLTHLLKVRHLISLEWLAGMLYDLT